MMSVPLERETIQPIFDAVLPGLLELLLSKEILKPAKYTQLIRPDDGDDYAPEYWNERALGYAALVLITRLPLPPEWCVERFFVVKVA